MQPESILRPLLTFGFARGTNYRTHWEQEVNRIYFSICCVAYGVLMCIVLYRAKFPFIAQITFVLELGLVAGTKLWFIEML